MAVTWVEKSALSEAVAQRVLSTGVVLDVGPGIRPQTLVPAELLIFAEAHRPYVERLRAIVGEGRRAVFLNGRWDAALALLLDRSVDSVFALDFIEHLEKEDGKRFLTEAARVARDQVVIFTPLGFYPQSYDDPAGADRWGMDGGYWQTHRSGWTPDDFDAAWDVLCCREFHTVDEHDRPLPRPFGALWAFRSAGSASAGDAVRPRWGTVAAARGATPRGRLAGALRSVLPTPLYRALRGTLGRVIPSRS